VLFDELFSGESEYTYSLCSLFVADVGE
jgi:hypothetical protein